MDNFLYSAVKAIEIEKDRKNAINKKGMFIASLNVICLLGTIFYEILNKPTTTIQLIICILAKVIPLIGIFYLRSSFLVSSYGQINVLEIINRIKDSKNGCSTLELMEHIELIIQIDRTSNDARSAKLNLGYYSALFGFVVLFILTTII